MIGNDNTNELRGQLGLEDLMGTGEGVGAPLRRPPEGYDAEGNLLNPSGPSGHLPLEGETRDGDDAQSLPLQGKVPPEGADEVVPPHTSAETDAARLAALATEINAITEQTRGVVISAALAVGKRLIEAKSLCPPGRFGEWLAGAVSYSERKAQDMMRLYLEYGRDGSIPESIAALDYSKAVALLAAPAEDREALAERAAGEDMSVRALQDEIKALKIERAKAQMRIDTMEGQIAGQRDEIARLDEREREYDQAIVDRDGQLKAATVAIEKERDAARLANAKAAAAEASADQLRKLHSDAEERASMSAQRASDAVNRANETAKLLTEARARIAALEEQAAAATPEPRTVEVVPEAVTRELDDLRRQLAEAKALSAANTPASPLKEEVSASERFKWFYANQMKPAFNTALELLREVAKEDGHAADLFATAMVKGCQALMNQLGVAQ